MAMRSGLADDICVLAHQLFLRVERIQSFLEATSVALFSFCQGFEPISDFVEPFITGGSRHTGVHIRIFVRLAGNGGFKVIDGATNRLARRRITRLFKVF